MMPSAIYKLSRTFLSGPKKLASAGKKSKISVLMNSLTEQNILLQIIFSSSFGLNIGYFFLYTPLYVKVFYLDSVKLLGVELY